MTKSIKRAKIKRIRAFALKFLRFFYAFLFMLTIVRWVFVDSPIIKSFLALQDPIKTTTGLVRLEQVAWSNPSLLLGFLSSLISSLCLIISTRISTRIFSNYNKGIIFNASNARSYKMIGFLFCADALVMKPISEACLSLAATLSNPAGSRVIALSFGTPHIECLCYGFLIIVISWIMQHGCLIQKDLDLTI